MATLRYKSRFLLRSPSDSMIEDGCVVVDGGKVVYAGPAAGSKELGPFEETMELGDSLILPGFVNTHCHSAMSLLRGVGNGMTLEDWLRKKVWPLEDHIKEEEMVAGNVLSLMEYAKTGVTSFIDFYNVRPLLKALDKVRLRCKLSLAFLDLAPSMKEESWRRLGQVGAYRREVTDAQGMRSLALAIHSTYACSPEMLKGVSDAASTYGLMATGHLMEAATEYSLVRGSTGKSPVALLEESGLLARRFLAAHCVHLDRRGQARLARAGVSVSHCPRSNSRLGVGIAPVKEMARAGLNVGLGTDGVGSADSADFFEEMRVAAYLQRAASSDAGLLQPRELLAMATCNGAKALGARGDGVLRSGGDADFISIRLDRGHLNPLNDLLGNVVFCSRPEDVLLTVSGGAVVQRGGSVEGVDEASVVREVREIAASLG